MSLVVGTIKYIHQYLMKIIIMKKINFVNIINYEFTRNMALT